MDRFFLPESAEAILGPLQFAGRAVIMTFLGIGVMILTLFGALIVSGLVLMYFFLSTPNGEISLLLRHRYDISLLFGAGFAGGYVALSCWKEWSAAQANHNHILRYDNCVTAAGPLLIACAASLWKMSDTAEKAAAIARAKKRDDTAAALLANTKVGTISVDGEPATDVTAADVMKMASGLAAGPTKARDEWIAKRELPVTALTRAVGGFVAGCATHFIGGFLYDLLAPIFIQILLGGDKSFVLNYLSKGMRAALAVQNAALPASGNEAK
jgi:hypothetical protein